MQDIGGLGISYQLALIQLLRSHKCRTPNPQDVEAVLIPRGVPNQSSHRLTHNINEYGTRNFQAVTRIDKQWGDPERSNSLVQAVAGIWQGCSAQCEDCWPRRSHLPHAAGDPLPPGDRGGWRLTRLWRSGRHTNKNLVARACKRHLEDEVQLFL